MTETEKPSTVMERHAQTMLVLLLVALLVWVGGTTQATAVAVAEMRTEIAYMQRQILKPDSKFKEIELRLDSIERQLGEIRMGQNNHENQNHDGT